MAVSLLGVLAILLAACGDTATPATTSAAAATTNAATTSVAAGATTTSAAAGTTTAATTTSSAATTISGTAMASGTPAMMAGTAMASVTPAMTNSGMTMGSGTPAMTSGTAMASGTPAMTSGTSSFPTISGATVVPADQVIAPALAQQLAAVGIKPSGVQFYVSDSDAATLATAADTAISGSGYKFNIPGFSKPLTLPGASNTIGLYNQSGQPDLLVLIAAIPTDPTKVNSTFLLPGLGAATDQQIVTGLQGHKTAMILLSGTNLQQAIITLVTGAAKSMVPGAAGVVSNVTGSATAGLTTPTTPATP